MRKGLEALNITEARLKELGMEGFAAPVKVSCEDHNGHHKVFVAEWDGTKWQKASDWIEPMKDKVRPLHRGRRQGLCREEHRLAEALGELRQAVVRLVIPTRRRDRASRLGGGRWIPALRCAAAGMTSSVLVKGL